MGLSLDLARGRVMVNGLRVRLLLRHSDGWALFEFDSRRMPASGSPDLQRVQMRVVSEDRPIDLTSETMDISAGPSADELLVSDRALGALYRVDREGQAKLISSLVGLPQALTPALATRLRPMPREQEPWPPPATAPSSPNAPDANGRVASIVLFAPDGPLIDPANSSRPDPADVQTQYPALLVLQNDHFRPVGRQNIRAGGSVAVYTLRLRQLVPCALDTWAAYDAASGQIMRVKLSEKR
jgi:hypothetical protein